MAECQLPKLNTRVRFPSPAPNSINPNLIIVEDGLGFIVFEEYPNFNSKNKYYG